MYKITTYCKYYIYEILIKMYEQICLLGENISLLSVFALDEDYSVPNQTGPTINANIIPCGKVHGEWQTSEDRRFHISVATQIFSK